MDVVNKIDACLKECLENSDKTGDELFEIFNRLLIKHRTKQTKPMKLKKKRKIVCRPAMIISDSSDND
tara:strand:+ start:1746 stop:1949 length:204 start_codon:yes stop_codon:yes gene_type:complete